MVCESVINAIILVDFILKVWLKVSVFDLKGFRVYIWSVSNIFDFIVVIACVGTFLFYLSCKSNLYCSKIMGNYIHWRINRGHIVYSLGCSIILLNLNFLQKLKKNKIKRNWDYWSKHKLQGYDRVNSSWDLNKKISFRWTKIKILRRSHQNSKTVIK